MLSATCNQKELQQAIKLVARGVRRKGVTPIQNNIMLEVKKENGGYQLHLAADDQEYMSFSTVMDIEDGEEGAITVPPAVLGSMVGKLVSKTVTLEETENNRLDITGADFKSFVHGLPADDFERRVGGEYFAEFEIPQTDLRTMLRQTVFAAHTDETRPILTGLLFDIKGEQLNVVSTDTYRLCVYSYTFPAPVVEEATSIVYGKMLQEVLRLLKDGKEEPVIFRLGEDWIEVVVGDVVLGTPPIEGQYVPYEKVIPAETKGKAILDVAELAAALKRAQPVAKHDAHRVVFAFKPGEVELSAQSKDTGSCGEVLEAETEGELITTAFNGNYMHDMVSVCGTEQVVIETISQLSPVIVRPVGADNFIYVVMPMVVMQVQ